MFLQAAFLIGLAAVLVPIMVHLLSRQQIVRVELGTTRFLMEVISDTSRRRRLRRWLLLLTRMATVAVAALLFARPALPTFDELIGGALRVVLIDRSASMQAPGQNGRAIDEAINAARTELERVGKKKVELWGEFDSHIEPISILPGAQPRVTAKPAGDTNYAVALAWARDRIAAEKHANVEVLLVTDLQMTGLAGQREPGDELLPANAPVRILDVGRRDVQNLAIQSIEKRHSSPADEKTSAATPSSDSLSALPRQPHHPPTGCQWQHQSLTLVRHQLRMFQHLRWQPMASRLCV